jgi:hypothetical protein
MHSRNVKSINPQNPRLNDDFFSSLSQSSHGRSIYEATGD